MKSEKEILIQNLLLLKVFAPIPAWNIQIFSVHICLDIQCIYSSSKATQAGLLNLIKAFTKYVKILFRICGQIVFSFIAHPQYSALLVFILSVYTFIHLLFCLRFKPPKKSKREMLMWDEIRMFFLCKISIRREDLKLC